MAKVLERLSAADKRAARPKAGRVGRPPREVAGEVEARILDAARQAFLEHGLAGASIDEIASLAGAGKPTIYARYPNKEALFAAVVGRNVATVIAKFEGRVPAGTTIEERLTNLGASLLDWALAAGAVDLMRVGISEARRFPELASRVHEMAHRCGEDAVAQLLGEAAQSDGLGSLPAFSPERIETTTHFFMDLVFKPPIMRALFGETLKSLRAQVRPHAERSVAFFLAACRQQDR